VKTLSFQLSQQSITQAIKELNEYVQWVESKKKLLLSKLGQIGYTNAQIGFANAPYNGIPGVSNINVSYIDDGNKFVIKANGKAVCFIEFGAGVFYNSNASYPEKRPKGIVGIGEYGSGKGKRNAWGYYDDETGELKITRGTVASMPLYKSKQEMIRQFQSIAREVFSQ
jgi:hypothetical protein